MNSSKFKESFSSFLGKLNFFTKKQKPISTKTGGGAKAFMSKLSGAFLLPIAILAVAGLFLGIGATIAGNAGDSHSTEVFGNFIKQLGDPLFGALPLLFCAAIVISFTEEAGVGVFNAIVGYLVFSALQSVFIEDVTRWVQVDTADGMPIIKQEVIGYTILFNGGGRYPEDLKALVGYSFGIKSLQTSVFGGILVGLGIQWAYNKFHTIKLPAMFAFFSGKRFVAFVVVALMIPYAFVFLLLWPYVGYAFSWFGQNSGKIPYGFDSFIFGFIERSLVPFGLHHVFYSPLWYTAAGADVQSVVNDFLKEGNTINAKDLDELAKVLKGNVSQIISGGVTFNGIVGASVVGDSTTSLALLGYNGNDVHYTLKGETTESSKPLFMFIQDELGLKIGRFLQGKFSFMQWGLPFAGLAMVLAAPKENRKIALGVVFPASLTCFVTGVTEPIEFTFLFLAPAMFFGFHAFMCATSFLLMNVLSVHIAQSFSGGFLDLMLYGAVPVMKGTNFWWTFVVGAGYAPIYFFVFYFWIIKADLPTPGRGGNTKLFTKKDYLDQKEGENHVNSEISPQVIGIINGFGGKENIVKTANCASRLRFDVVDADKVSEDVLKSFGAFGLRRTSNTHVQAIFGPKSEQLRVEIDKALKMDGSSLKINLEEDKKIYDEAHQKEENAKSNISSNAINLSIDASEFKKFIDSFGGIKNVLGVTKRNDQIIFKFKKLSKSINVKSINLFHQLDIELVENSVKLKYDDANAINHKIKEAWKELNEKNTNQISNEIHSPVNKGKLKSLSELNDGVFSEKVLGDGFVVEQKDGNVYAPISGKLVTVFPTGHAFGIQNENGLNVLVHIGIDTVNLQGKGFDVKVQQDQFVKQGELLACVDLKLLEENKYISDVIVVVTQDSTMQPKSIINTNLKPSLNDIVISEFE